METAFNKAVFGAINDDSSNLRFKTLDYLKSYHSSVKESLQRKEALHRNPEEKVAYFNFVQNIQRTTTPILPWISAPGQAHVCQNVPQPPLALLTHLPLSPLPNARIPLSDLVGETEQKTVSRRQMHCSLCGKHKGLDTGHKRGFCPSFPRGKPRECTLKKR
jgi:hypothetical protein